MWAERETLLGSDESAGGVLLEFGFRGEEALIGFLGSRKNGEDNEWNATDAIIRCWCVQVGRQAPGSEQYSSKSIRRIILVGLVSLVEDTAVEHSQWPDSYDRN